MKSLFARLVPFILLGIALVAFVFGLMLLAYLLFFGALVGIGLFGIAWVKERFFPSKNIVPRNKTGRTIDQD